MCSVDYSATCSSTGRESISTVIFRVDHEKSTGFIDPNSLYEATVAFLWGEDDGDGIGGDDYGINENNNNTSNKSTNGANGDNATDTVVITDLYPIGEIITLSDKHLYDEPGLHRIGYRFRFGAGAGSCENKTSSIVSLVRIEERSCEWGVEVVETENVLDDTSSSDSDGNSPSFGLDSMGSDESGISTVTSDPAIEASRNNASDQNGDIAAPDYDVMEPSPSTSTNISNNETKITATTITNHDFLGNGNADDKISSSEMSPTDQTMGIGGNPAISTTMGTRTWPPSMSPLFERESNSAGTAKTIIQIMGFSLWNLIVGASGIAIVLWVL